MVALLLPRYLSARGRCILPPLSPTDLPLKSVRHKFYVPYLTSYIKMFAYLISLCIIVNVMKTKIIKQSLRSGELKQSLRSGELKKLNKNLKEVTNAKNLKPEKLDGKEDKAEEHEKVEKLETHPKKPSPRSPKFQDSEYISELDRDFGFDLNQDPLTEDL